MSEENKSNKPWKIVIPVIAIAAVLFVGGIVAAFTGVLGGNPKQIILKAIQDTVLESRDYIKEEWELRQFDGMFEEDDRDFTMELNLDLPDGVGLDVTAMTNTDATRVSGNMSIAGLEAIQMELYQDDAEIIIALPEMLSYLLYIDRDTMADDIHNLVDMGLIDQSQADELVMMNEGIEDTEEVINDETIEAYTRDVLNAFQILYDDCEVKKAPAKELEVNGETRSCKGYRLIFTYQELADFSLNLKAVIEEHDDYVEAINTFYYNLLGYEIMNGEELRTSLQDAADELLKDAGREQDIEVYLYDHKIAQMYLEDEEASLSWNVSGGSFPLENTSICLEDGDSYPYLFERTGYMENDVYYATYSFGEMYEDEPEYGVDLTHNKESGDISLEYFEYGFGRCLLEANIEKVSETEMKISIDSLEIEEEEILSGDIILSSQCGTIEKPEGEPVNLLQMTETDWVSLIMEIGMYFYEFE